VVDVVALEAITNCTKDQWQHMTSRSDSLGYDISARELAGQISNQQRGHAIQGLTAKDMTYS
jgi:hypothetical protein